MFAHRRIRFECLALPLILASFGDASAGEVSKPLLTCINEAAAAQQIEFTLEPNHRPPVAAAIVLICEGPAAGALFQAIEGVATNDMSNQW
jgi:hypothetical protein